MSDLTPEQERTMMMFRRRTLIVATAKEDGLTPSEAAWVFCRAMIEAAIYHAGLTPDELLANVNQQIVLAEAESEEIQQRMKDDG